MGKGARHLVLGGSTGIGYAYAERYARLGDELVIAARDSTRLEQAKQRLLAAGAPRVDTRSSDLAEPDARAALLHLLGPGARFSTVFVGGPGPAAGHADEVSDEDHARAREVCLEYPGDLLDRATELIEVGGRLVQLSSSAADEPLEGHRFYLSALYRRQLDHLLLSYAGICRSNAIEMIVLKPKVTLTPLSERFARRVCQDQSPTETLSAYFGVSKIDTPKEYIRKVLKAPSRTHAQSTKRV